MTSLATAFFHATRPHTYPLAVSGIVVGNALAFCCLKSFDRQNWLIFALSLWVALGLQILSNLANDYGDGVKGTDNHRLDRQTAQGRIKHRLFKQLIIGWAIFIFACGVGLLWLSFHSFLDIAIFLALGILSIIAAMAYTMGKKPYGYHAKGEIAVFLFFGWVSVLGSLYLHTQTLHTADMLAATIVGLLCSCVLMVNNMRDIDEDRQAGKNTLAVKFGKATMSQSYTLMLIGAYFLLLTFAILKNNPYLLTTLPLIYPLKRHLSHINAYGNATLPPHKLAEQLKPIVLITLATSVILAISLVIKK